MDVEYEYLHIWLAVYYGGIGCLSPSSSGRPKGTTIIVLIYLVDKVNLLLITASSQYSRRGKYRIIYNDDNAWTMTVRVK